MQDVSEPTIVDVFQFFDELDLLRVRLEELSPVVDRFVLCEATRTFTNKPKPLVYATNRERFSDFDYRIEHVVIDQYDGIDQSDPWAMDYGQKQRGLDIAQERLRLGAHDLVIVSDCDEIPRAEAVSHCLTSPHSLVALEMPLYYYWMNCVCTNRKLKACRVVRPTGHRMIHRSIRYGHRRLPTLRQSGWHFSYLGDIRHKLESFAHSATHSSPQTMA